MRAALRVGVIVTRRGAGVNGPRAGKSLPRTAMAEPGQTWVHGPYRMGGLYGTSGMSCNFSGEEMVTLCFTLALPWPGTSTFQKNMCSCSFFWAGGSSL